MLSFCVSKYIRYNCMHAISNPSLLFKAPHPPMFNHQSNKLKMNYSLPLIRLIYEIDSMVNWCNNNTVPDPDLEIRGWGGESMQSSRPLEKGGPVSKKIFFGPGLKIRGEGGQAPRSLPWICHCNNKFIQYYYLYTWCYRLKYNN